MRVKTLQFSCIIFFTTFATHMLKRSIAISLLVLASTVWLAHAILPHHHHNSMACLVTEHCRHDNDIHTHNPESGSHDHDNSKSSNCTLNQSVIVPQSGLKGYSGIAASPANGSYLDFIQAIVAYTHSIAFLSPKTHTVYLNSVSTKLYLASIGKSLGLRAPPEV